MRIAILTVSDAGARGEREDTSGAAIAAWAAARGDEVAARALVPDDSAEIVRHLVRWCDDDAADLVLTTGGTGLSPRDVTPEATLAVIEREAPGIAERIRWTAGGTFPRAALSRGIAGVRAGTLVVNLPGSTGGVRDALAALDPIVGHACDILRGRATDHSGPVRGAEGGSRMTAVRAGRAGLRDVERSHRALITLADVEPAVRINALLEADGMVTEMVSPVDDVRAALRRAHPDVVVLTGALLDRHNVALVRHLLWDGVPVVGLTDVSDAQTTERLRDAGFTLLYPKPVVPEDVADGVRRLLDRRRMQQLTGLIGESEAIHEVLVKVEQIAPVSSTVLIEGESGTGKELVARAIHRMSPRRGKPFIAVNVGALPETLLESELFGHEKGAFTGAAERRLGRFELADTGTLFLDEIGEIPQATQVKLLRVLEEREVTRLGAAQPIEVDVRVVAATNRPLREHVMEGSFRADLFYRLDVLRIYLPPLRERRSDIPLLVRMFVAEFSARHDRPFHGIASDAMALLMEYPWPGNVRELRNLIESMVVLAPGREIRPDELPRHLREGSELSNARLLPVAIGSMVRDGERAQGRELEFIVRSLLELKLQVEELRRRLDEERARQSTREVGAGGPAAGGGGDVALVGVAAPAGVHVAALEARETAPPANTVTITPGMTMAEIERAAIEAALRETGGNRRRASELLGIGERTLYRKLHEYQLPEAGSE